MAQILNNLDSQRILLLEFIGQNLDNVIYNLRKKIKGFQVDKSCLSNYDQRKKSLEKITSIQKHIMGISTKALKITRHFHKQVQEDKKDLKNNITGPNALSKKIIGYESIIAPPEELRNNKKKKKELSQAYDSITKFISGNHLQTKELRNIIHADLHYGNIVLDELDNIRFTDAGNVITDGTTIAFDIATQLFNPPVFCIEPEKVEDLIKSAYLENEPHINPKYLASATLIAAAVYCCPKFCAGNIIRKKRDLDQYKNFLNLHENHQGAVEKYVKLSHLLLEFLINNSEEFKLESKLSDSLKRVRDIYSKLHRNIKEPQELEFI